MSAAIQRGVDEQKSALLRECVAALLRVAGYRLPSGLDRRLLWRSENQERLSGAEREELLALVEFSDERTIEKLQARVVLQKLRDAWPELVDAAP